MPRVGCPPPPPAVALTPELIVRRRPFFRFLIFPLCDSFAIAAVGAFVLLLQPGLNPEAAVQRYLALWPVPLAVLTAFACAGLYPGIIHNAVDELRRLGLTLTATFL